MVADLGSLGDYPAWAVLFHGHGPVDRVLERGRGGGQQASPSGPDVADEVGETGAALQVAGVAVLFRMMNETEEDDG